MNKGLLATLAIVITAVAVFIACRTDQTSSRDAGRGGMSGGDQVFVAPGKLDDYYAFLSGGQSGSVFVYGIPSCRFIREIAIFEPRAALGYANNPDSETYHLLAASGPLWGDTHHPVLSQTGNRYDGKWLWNNDKANDRIAKIDLSKFEATVIKRVPNIQGAHGLAAFLPDSKYVYVNGELEHDFEGNSGDPTKYRSVIAFLDGDTLETRARRIISLTGSMCITIPAIPRPRTRTPGNPRAIGCSP